MGALPCNAAVEVQPVLVDPADSMLDDSDDDAPDCVHGPRSPSGGLQERGVMAGWVGRLQNAQYSLTTAFAGGRVRLDSCVLWAHGRFCRCLVSVAPDPDATLAGEESSLGSRNSAPTTPGAAFATSDVLAAPDEARAVADRAIVLINRSLDNSGLEPSACALLKAYYVGTNGAALAHALEPVLHQLIAGHAELCSLPVIAVGFTSAVSAFLLVECTAMLIPCRA